MPTAVCIYIQKLDSIYSVVYSGSFRMFVAIDSSESSLVQVPLFVKIMDILPDKQRFKSKRGKFLQILKKIINEKKFESFIRISSLMVY